MGHRQPDRDSAAATKPPPKPGPVEQAEATVTEMNVMSWWQWVRTFAENAPTIFLTEPLDQREQTYPRDTLPPQHAQVES